MSGPVVTPTRYRFRGLARRRIRSVLNRLAEITVYNLKHPDKNLLSAADISAVLLLSEDLTAALAIRDPR